MKKRIYIETTIPSFYYTLRTDIESVARRKWTREWWDLFVENSSVATSAAVVAELRHGSHQIVAERLDLLRGLEMLEVTAEVEKIAQIYIDHLIMPQDPTGDAMHLAISSYHKMDILLTWNCAHIANPNKFDRIRLINFELGLPTPILTTPLNYLGKGES